MSRQPRDGRTSLRVVGDGIHELIESDRDLFVRELRELYHDGREREDLQSGLAESATDEDLEEFFAAHGETTTDQIGRLEAPFDAIEAEVDPGPIENGALEGFREDRDEFVADLQDPILGDTVDAELARAIERLEITKVETLLELADRTELPNEVVEELETTKTEMETGLDRARELTTI
ncbi:ferritin-like domain-containing protein [Halosolutus halophilus]|uniref:ferritin-like domain-containing protein n=1 Tax=Halosolutus halophilus TaxID=1552990 RepID=UPI00223504E4|nr:ferritin-like domain-containing protein [Halosolutus halophilus]